MTGKTRSGFEYTIDESILDDWEFIEVLRKSEDDPLNIIDIFNFMLGKDQYAKLKQHVAEGGKVTVAKMQAELVDIMNNSKAKK